MPRFLLVLIALPLLAEPAPTFNAIQKKWWAIQPVANPAPPALDEAGKAWARNEIDHFIYDKLKAKNITPAPLANKQTFIRRVTLDLTGLPPPPPETPTIRAHPRRNPVLPRRQ